MKNILLAALLCMTAIGVSAQDANTQASQVKKSDKKFYYGFKIGLNMSTTTTPESASRLGWQAGAFCEYEIVPSFAIQPGLMYATKGSTYKVYSNINGQGWYKTIEEAHYIKMPINFIYKVRVSPTGKITFNLGPYFAYGVGGQITDVKLEGAKESRPTFSSNDRQRFAAGIGVGVGGEFKRTLVNLGYEAGLTSISKTADNQNLRNSTLFFSLGWRF